MPIDTCRNWVIAMVYSGARTIDVAGSLPQAGGRRDHRKPSPLRTTGPGSRVGSRRAGVGSAAAVRTRVYIRGVAGWHGSECGAAAAQSDRQSQRDERNQSIDQIGRGILLAQIHLHLLIV